MTEKAQFPGCLMNVVKMLDGRRKMEEFNLLLLRISKILCTLAAEMYDV
jgi:hypothetical protein